MSETKIHPAFAAVDPDLRRASNLVKSYQHSDNLSVKALSDRGFDCTDGETVVYKNTPMWPHSALTDDDPYSAEWRAQQSILLDRVYEGAFAKWISLSLRWLDPDNAFGMLPQAAKDILTAGWELKGLHSASETAGGFLLPAEWSAQIASRRAEASVFRRRATIRTTIRDRLVVPRLQPNQSSPSLYGSALTADWVGETTGRTGDDPVFGTVELPIKKLRAPTVRLSRDLYEDAPTLVTALVGEVGQNLGPAEDAAFLTGDGTDRPLGLLTDTTVTTVDIEGSTSNTISSTLTLEGSTPKLINLAYSVPSQYRRNSVWLMRGAVEKDVRSLIDNDGRRQFPRDASGAIEGFPVEVSDAMPDDGADGAQCVVFGDLGGYIIGDRTAFSAVLLRERFAESDQLGLIVFDRVGGALHNADSLRVGVV